MSRRGRKEILETGVTSALRFIAHSCLPIPIPAPSSVPPAAHASPLAACVCAPVTARYGLGIRLPLRATAAHFGNSLTVACTPEMNSNSRQRPYRPSKGGSGGGSMKRWYTLIGCLTLLIGQRADGAVREDGRVFWFAAVESLDRPPTTPSSDLPCFIKPAFLPCVALTETTLTLRLSSVSSAADYVLLFPPCGYLTARRGVLLRVPVHVYCG